MGLKRCLPGLRDTGLGLCPPTSPLPAACPSLPAQTCPLSAQSYCLPRLAHKLLGPSFLPAYPVPLPASLLPTHLPFSVRSSHLLPLRISGSALIYVGYSEPYCSCWLWCLGSPTPICPTQPCSRPQGKGRALRGQDQGE